MKAPRFTLIPLILVVTVASLSLPGCNTTAGFGRDVAAGAGAVTDAAEENRGY